MRRETVFVTLSVCITIVAASAIIARGGPLDPPQGPISPSYKTLDEVEPRIPVGPDTTPGDEDSIYKITEPGSYYLTGVVEGVNNKHGIEISASSVTLDLNGFEVHGSVLALDGIHVSNQFIVDVVIRNGIVQAWGGDCISAVADDVRIDSVNATLSINGAGFHVGDDARITNCVAQSVASGFVGGDNCWIDGCTARQVGTLYGFDFGFGCTIQNSAAYQVEETGIHLSGGTIRNCSARACGGMGIFVFLDGVVEGCRAVANGDDGIRVEAGGVVSGCVANNNGTDGIAAGSDVTIESSKSDGNAGPGFGVGGNGVISECTATSNDAHGFTVGLNTMIRGCVAVGNDQNGIDTTDNAFVVDCLANNNGNHGVRVDTDCIVRTCLANDNVQYGMSTINVDNWFEGNKADHNQRGINVQNIDNVITRNQLRSNNIDSVISGGNAVGTIVVSNGAMNSAENDLINIEF